MRARPGFTLIELMIVLVIIGVLYVIALPLYRGHVRHAIAAEGKTLVGACAGAQRVYYTEWRRYHSVALTSFDPVLDIDVRTNKYFRTFECSAAGDEYTVTAIGEGDAVPMNVVLTQTAMTPATVSVYGE